MHIDNGNEIRFLRLQDDVCGCEMNRITNPDYDSNMRVMITTKDDTGF